MTVSSRRSSLPQCQREREAFDPGGTVDPLDRAVASGAITPLRDSAIARAAD
jgi:hypothetical protein